MPPWGGIRVFRGPARRKQPAAILAFSSRSMERFSGVLFGRDRFAGACEPITLIALSHREGRREKPIHPFQKC
jgi:hypothetical protein